MCTSGSMGGNHHAMRSQAGLGINCHIAPTQEKKRNPHHKATKTQKKAKNELTIVCVSQLLPLNQRVVPLPVAPVLFVSLCIMVSIYFRRVGRRVNPLPKTQPIADPVAQP